ncbi:MAG TPA: hypothetical protein V6D27_00045 [Vampirovibrionales bacterium]
MVTFDAVAPIFSSSGNRRSRSHPIWMQFLLKVGDSLPRDRCKNNPTRRV